MKRIFLLLFLVSINSIAQKKVQVDLSNPNATIYTHLYFLQPDSYEPEKAAVTIQGYSGEEAIDKAIKLKQILDGKGLFVDFSKIPNDHDFNDTIGYSKSYKYTLFPVRMPLISVEKVGNKWLYAQETVRSIDAMYNEVFPWYVQKLQKIIPAIGHQKLFGVEIWQIIALLILLTIAFVLFYVIKKIAFSLLQKIQYKITHSKNDEVNKVLKKLSRPISLLIAFAFFESVFPSLLFGLDTNKWVFLSLNIATTVFWIYVFLKLVQVTMRIYAEFAERTHGKLDDQLVPILHNFLTGVVVFLGILKLLTLFGVNVATVIAGASIGGIAVALASQDTVKNLIGTFMIFLDKPFHIGDWIEADNVIGTVEEVGFRSTRVRAADTSVYQIPNSKLSEIVINNKGLRLYRRYRTDLGIRYDTPPILIEAFVKGVKEIIIAHPETKSDAYNVEFNGFGDSALLIMVNVYFKSLEWDVEQSSKHRLHMAIVKMAAALGVEFAFPSTTLMIEQFPEKKSIDLKYNTTQKSIEKAIKNVIDDFSQSSTE